MDPLTEVRLRARARHAEALAGSGGDRSAQAIAAAALRLGGIEVAASPLAQVGRASLQKAGRGILKARHAALHVDVMERATLASLERIVAATSPKAVEAAAGRKDPVLKGEAPAAEAARLLQAAALEEIRETRASTEKARRALRYQVGKAVNEWKALVGAPPPTVTLAMRIALARADAAVGPAREGGAHDEVQRQSSREVAVEVPSMARGAGARRGNDALARAASAGRGAVSAGSTTSPLARAGRRAPTLAEAQAASSAVSGWIKAIRNAAPDDVDRRIAMLDALVESIRPSRNISDAAGPATGLETQTQGGAAERPAKAGGATDGTAGGVATSANPTTVAPEEIAARAASIGDARPRVRATAAGSVAPRLIGTVVPVGALTATDRQPFDKPEERADDERRRREREEEIEKRKRKRRAVLSRRNRGRGR
ncbi:hypothetical protein [Lichenibacterium ramalinae]|uniref:Uncharacterized protein n=1 Tax=Lichenibacterium ramalinae TaxID=2316527 RepID=A0A4Q2RBN0_9HYPH|nr:hypothetical protein [Lichenibacterium ramalinae]RYB04326.1 hypothetical protein D3272_12760 [Lichenibacterium ramalinae]